MCPTNTCQGSVGLHTCKLHILCLSDFSTSTVLTIVLRDAGSIDHSSLDMCRVCGCPIARPICRPTHLLYQIREGNLKTHGHHMMHSGQKQCSVGKRCTVAIFMTEFSLWQFDVLMTERIIQIFIKIEDYFFIILEL